MRKITTTVATLLCTCAKCAHSCEETQGMWMTKVSGTRAFFCDCHAVDEILELLDMDMPEERLLHVPLHILEFTYADLFAAMADEYMSTPYWDMENNTEMTRLTELGAQVGNALRQMRRRDGFLSEEFGMTDEQFLPAPGEDDGLDGIFI